MTVIATEDERALTNEDALVTGVGALNVIEALRDIPRDTPIYNVGYAGSNTLKVGTKHRIGRVRLYHPNVEFADREYELGDGILCYTAGDFITAAKTLEPCVFDMELAYILALGFTNVIADKVVSDTLSLEEYEECLKK